MASRTEGPQIKTITVYRNGDAFFTGRKVVVNPRHFSSFDGLLASLTPGMEARFGAVRKLFSLPGAKRLRRLDELEHGGLYVAGGNEAFKKLDYGRITNKMSQNKEKEEPAPIRPVVHSKTVVPSRCTTIKDGSLIIQEKNVPPARIRLPKYTLKSWENVLTIVSERVKLRTGAVFSLSTIDGQIVHGPSELENNKHYIAVGSEKFKAFKNDQRVHGWDLERENSMIKGKDLISANPKKKHANHLSAHTGFREDLEHTARGHMKKDKAGGAKHEKQASRNPALFQMGEGSVFNAQNKRREMAEALEVQEDSELKVDLPIDLVEAMTVEEECGDGSCCSSFCEVSLHNSDNFCSAAGEPEVKEVSSKPGIRSQMSWFFKGRLIKA